jgi:hypothetical protein
MQLMLAKLRAKLTLFARVQHTSDQLRKAKDKLRKAKDKLGKAKLKQEKLRNKLHRSNRTVPAVAGVLPELLARRRSDLPPLSSRDEAMERERDFANRSSAYRENTKIGPDDVLVTSDNIAVWELLSLAYCRHSRGGRGNIYRTLSYARSLARKDRRRCGRGFIRQDRHKRIRARSPARRRAPGVQAACRLADRGGAVIHAPDRYLDGHARRRVANGLTHFIDMSPRAPGQIARPIGEFAEAMGWLDTIDISAGGKQQTDILCFNA